jgi:hypothetical protein
MSKIKQLDVMESSFRIYSPLKGEFICDCSSAPFEWSARSPDLKLLDCYLWDHVEGIVYSAAANGVTEQGQKDGRELIPNMPSCSEHVKQSLRETFRGDFFHNLLL